MKPENSLTSFEDQTPKELVNGSFYSMGKESLSIQCWNKEGNRMVMYIAFAKESPNIHIPQLERKEKGGRVLMFYAHPDLLPTSENGYTDRLLPLLNDVMSRITNGCDEKGERLFDYIWFDVNDFSSVEIIRRVGFSKACDRIVYKTLR
ncbi:MAG: hypothetical protein IKH44_04385 [Bacteroidales bacterium]|nr:hypothetical protein [Bacteroidales bacterium]